MLRCMWVHCQVSHHKYWQPHEHWALDGCPLGRTCVCVFGALTLGVEVLAGGIQKAVPGTTASLGPTMDTIGLASAQAAAHGEAIRCDSASGSDQAAGGYHSSSYGHHCQEGNSNDLD